MDQPTNKNIFTIDVAGINFQKENIASLIKQATEDPTKSLPVKCIPEPENEYDKEAVRVEINGLKVGYMARKTRDQYRSLCEPGSTQRQALEKLITQGATGKIEDWGEFKEGSYFCQVTVLVV